MKSSDVAELMNAAAEVMTALKPYAEKRSDSIRFIVIAVEASRVPSPIPGTYAYEFGNHLACSNVPPDALGTLLTEIAKHEMENGQSPVHAIRLTEDQLMGKGHDA